MDTEKERRRSEFPELNPDATVMTDEDRAENKGPERKGEPKPWAPPPRRHSD